MKTTVTNNNINRVFVALVCYNKSMLWWCDAGNSRWRWKQSSSSTQRRIRHYQWVILGSAAALPPNTQQHLSWEECNHHLPSADWTTRVLRPLDVRVTSAFLDCRHFVTYLVLNFFQTHILGNLFYITYGRLVSVCSSNKPRNRDLGLADCGYEV